MSSFISKVLIEYRLGKGGGKITLFSGQQARRKEDSDFPDNDDFISVI